MALTLSDLLEEEKRLKEIVTHAESELKAIQTLIIGRNLRKESEQGQLFTDIKSLSMKKSVLAIHKEHDNKWFNGAEMTEEIKRRDPSKFSKNLRTSAGNAQRDLCTEGTLIREDRGTEKVPNYSYILKNVVATLS